MLTPFCSMLQLQSNCSTTLRLVKSSDRRAPEAQQEHYGAHAGRGVRHSRRQPREADSAVRLVQSTP